MRKEINKSLKEEIDLRRKISIGEDSVELDDLLNVRDFAEKVEEFKKIKERKQKERLEGIPSEMNIPDVKEVTSLSDVKVEGGNNG
jgi:hypothetical protein